MKDGSLFDRVIGHEKAKRLFALALKNPRHGYVLTGPDGVGVHVMAEAFVRELTDEYKGESLLAHPDICLLERESSEKGSGLKKEISVQAVRELKIRVSERPTIASRLVVYIPDADYLNEEGVNALLKCIEEPAVPTVYVLAAHAVGKLPSTLLSRLVEIRLNRVSVALIRDWLVREGIDSVLAEHAASVSDGKPGYAWQYAHLEEARMQIDEAEATIRECAGARSSGELIAAFAATASACDTAGDPVTEWRKALQLWQASLRRINLGDPERIYTISRALILAERALGTSIPPRVWLELALANGFREPRPSIASLVLPRAFPCMPEKFS
jgi:hypothetical protein